MERRTKWQVDWGTAVMALCAVSVTGIVGARQIHDWRTVAEAPARSKPAPPAFVKDWRNLIASGERLGPQSAPVVVAEFGDFQCPVCRLFKRTYDSVSMALGDTVALVFVHFPLKSIHHFADAAARASECAANQGRFAAFYDLAYAKQDSLGIKTWQSFAREAGVPNLPQFDTCTSDTLQTGRVSRGHQAGEQLGVKGTPTLLINGWEYSGALRSDRLDSAIHMLLRGKPAPAFSRGR
ncbi:MAG TPA: thioredoxin domain-containing protein [Gemmatimonadaceae bacterium]|nr:thioredoxin domain-containing protein [Gemmatimonadaceae bacterium]